MHDLQIYLFLTFFLVALGVYLWHFRNVFVVNLYGGTIHDQPASTHRRFRELFEHSVDAIFVIASHKGVCRFESLNPAAMQMLDSEGVGLPGRRIDELNRHVAGYELRRALRTMNHYIEQALENGMPVKYRDTFSPNSRAQLCNYEINLVPMVDDDGLSHILCFARDISLQQQYAAELGKRTRLEERLSGFIASAPGFFYSFEHGADGSNSMPFASSGIRELFGLHPDDVAISIANLNLRIHPDDMGRFFEATAASAAALSPCSVEFRVQHPERDIIWVESRAMPSRKSDGSIVWHGFMHDITDRKLAEQRLQQKRESLAEAQRIGQMGSWEIDLGGDCAVWTEEMFRILELDPSLSAASCDTLLNAVHPEDREIRRGAYAKALAGQQPFRIDYRLLFPDGRIKYVRESCEPHCSKNGVPLRLHGTVQDISALKITELQLQDTQGKLRELVINRELMRENERKRVAWEMHEELGQMLAAMKMRLGGLRTAAERGRNIPEAEFAIIGEIVDRSIKTVHEIVAELRPTVLMHGVTAGLEWLAAEFNKHPGIHCELFVDDGFGEFISDELTTLVFRVAQEALEDAMRHPGVSEVGMRWRHDEEGGRLTISHDGDATSSDLTASHSLRLFGMHERVAAVGGCFNINSCDDGGVMIEVHFPARAGFPELACRNTPTPIISADKQIKIS